MSEQLFEMDHGEITLDRYDPKYNDKNACAIVVSYNKVPNLTQYIKSIWRGDIDGLIIIDNSDSVKIINSIKEQISHDIADRVRLIENGINLGISKALNIGIREAIRSGYHYFFLLDDDATVSRDFFRLERKVFDKYSELGYKVGAVCPLVSNDASKLDRKRGLGNSISEIRRAITSGLLLNANVFNITGGYDERYFLEYADIDFTRRIYEAGFKIFRVNKVLVVQDFGKTLKENKFWVKLYWLVFSFNHGVQKVMSGGCNDIFDYLGLYECKRMVSIREALYYYEKQRYRNKRLLFFIKKLRLTLLVFVEGLFLYQITHDPCYLKIHLAIWHHDK